MKSLIWRILTAIVLSATAGSDGASASQNDYLNKLDQFKSEIRTQVDEVAIPQIKMSQLDATEQNATIEALKRFEASSELRIDQLGAAYRSLFLEEADRSPFKKNFPDLERWMIRGVDQGLELIFNALEASTPGKSSKSALKKNVARLNSLATQMSSLNTPIRNPGKRNAIAAMPLNDSRISISCRFAWDACIKGTALMKTFANLNYQDFIRGHQQERTLYEGWDPHRAFEHGGVYIVGFNHDYAFFDPVFAERLTKDMGADDVVFLTNKDAWPQYKIRKEKDPNIIFRQDTNPGPIERVVQRAKALHAQGRKVVILIAPEGQIPCWYAQAPLATKLGLHVTARRLAHEIGGEAPVQYVEAISNGLEQITGKGEVPMVIRLSSPMRVPDTPVAKHDLWVSENRLKFEEHVNAGRGIRQVDLIDRRFAPGVGVPVASEVAPYSPAMKLSRCLGSALTLKDGR